MRGGDPRSLKIILRVLTCDVRFLEQIFFSIFSKDRIVRHFFEFLKVTEFLIEMILINFYNFPNNSEILAWLIAIAGKDFYLLKIML